jgi:hypothetical protein
VDNLRDLKTVLCTAFILLLIVCPTSAFAQGEFLDGSQSGFGGALGLSANDQVTAIGVTGGYSLKSILDLSCTVGRNLDEFGDKAFGSSATLWWGREGRRPSEVVSFGVVGSFTQQDQGPWDIRTWQLSGVLLKRIRISARRHYIQPWISAGHIWPHGGYGLRNIWQFGFGTSLCFKVNARNTIFITPSYYRYTNSEASGGINVGMVRGL